MEPGTFISDDDVLMYRNILSAHPLFSASSSNDLDALIRDCTVRIYQEQEVVVNKGTLVDAVYFIISGQCEVRANASGESPEQPVATLKEGETIGLSNIGLYSLTGSRTATVVALGELNVLRIGIEIFRRFFKNHLSTDEIFSNQLDVLMRMHFIKSVAPFASIPNQHIRQIVEQIEEQSFPAGMTIFEQGDPGEVCYIITAGKVEISLRPVGGEPQILAKLEKHAIFGESALMMDGIRTATAIVVEAATLLKIDKALFQKITQQHTNAQKALMQLQLRRCRPIKVENIDVYKQKKADGSEVTILRNVALGKYVQLSEQGAFLWDLLDGESSMNDIAIQFYLQYAVFNVEDIATQIVNLNKAGFVQLSIHQKLIPLDQPIPGWLKIIGKIREVMEYRMVLGSSDAWMTKAFNRVGWIFFTKPALMLWMLLTILGFISFVAHFEESIHLLASSPHKWSLFYFQSFLVLLTIPFHELAHAFTTKYYGRNVHCFGLGWLWFGPFAFCDTSDMWLSPKKQRIMVDLAGVYLNMILAGVAGVCAFFTFPEHPEVTIILELFALNSYLFVIANLDTAFELDGYYALMDLLDKPNLRLSAIKWIITFFSGDETPGTTIVASNSKWESIKAHRDEVIYWLCILLYMFVISTMVPYFVFAYLLAGLFSTSSTTLILVMTLAAVIFSSLGIYKEFRVRVRSKTREKNLLD